MTNLNCGDTRVTDLSPLKGMPLTTLAFDETAVFDLSPLQEMPLIDLSCEGTRVADLTPLQRLNLRKLAFSPIRINKGVDFIRRMKSLSSIGIGWQATDQFSPFVFWKKYDVGEFNNPNMDHPHVADNNKNPFVPQPPAPGPLAVGGVPQQNPGEWIVTDNNQNVVAVFPELPQYIYHLSAEHGRMKEWRCTTKTGLLVSFQMLQKTAGDQVTLVAKLVGPGFQLNLDGNFSQEFVTPTMVARITFTETGLLV